MNYNDIEMLGISTLTMYNLVCKIGISVAGTPSRGSKLSEDIPMTPRGGQPPDTGLRIGRWVPDPANTTSRHGVRHRTDRLPAGNRVPPTDATPAPERAAAEPSRRRVRLSRRRVRLSRRRRLVAAGLAGVVSVGSVVALLQPAAEPAAVHAGPAPIGVTNPGQFSPGPQIPVSVEPSTAPASRPPSSRSPISPAPTTAPARVTILPADHERGLRSVESERETEIKFVNHRDEPIVINWLDYRGIRERYGVLAAGGVQEQHTYVNHPWVITDLRGRSLAVLLPTTRPAQVTIT
jgi:hypothetical protein